MFDCLWYKGILFLISDENSPSCNFGLLLLILLLCISEKDLGLSSAKLHYVNEDSNTLLLTYRLTKRSSQPGMSCAPALWASCSPCTAFALERGCFSNTGSSKLGTDDREESSLPLTAPLTQPSTELAFAGTKACCWLLVNVLSTRSFSYRAAFQPASPHGLSWSYSILKVHSPLLNFKAPVSLFLQPAQIHLHGSWPPVYHTAKVYSSFQKWFWRVRCFFYLISFIIWFWKSYLHSWLLQLLLEDIDPSPYQ